MKEVASSAGLSQAFSLPPEIVERFGRTEAAILRKSSIVWGEHCSECAFPSCYATCTHYTARADLNCRRFETGIESVAGHPEVLRVEFRRWAKLEGQGPAGLQSMRRATILERVASAAGGAVGLTWPHYLRDALGRRWDGAARRIVSEGSAFTAATIFAIETWNASDAATALRISFVSTRAGTAVEFGLVVPPGHQRAAIPATEIGAHVPFDAPYAIRIEVASGEPAPPLVFGQLDFVERSIGAAMPWIELSAVPGRSPAPPHLPEALVLPGPMPARPRIKCLVWDLDNTLWTGTLAEVGPEGVRLRPDAVALLSALDERGILNSIASKNDRQPALDALRRFGLIDFFLFPQIGWGPKSTAIRAIADDLDIGRDTIAFIDDQPFERGEVAELVPEVEVFEETAVATLGSHPRFDVPITPEARRRRHSYQTEQRRHEARATSGLDYDAFLRTCGLTLSISPLTPATAPRIHELTERTNQLNVSGRRYARAEIDAMARGERTALAPLVFSVADRFGDYGIVGFLVTNRRGGSIASLFMSCRVQRKRVEHALFGQLLRSAAAAGCDTLDIQFRPTARNAPALAMLESLGFTAETDPDGAACLRRSTREPIEGSDIVTVLGSPASRISEAGT